MVLDLNHLLSKTQTRWLLRFPSQDPCTSGNKERGLGQQRYHSDHYQWWYLSSYVGSAEDYNRIPFRNVSPLSVSVATPCTHLETMTCSSLDNIPFWYSDISRCSGLDHPKQPNAKRIKPHHLAFSCFSSKTHSSRVLLSRSQASLPHRG